MQEAAAHGKGAVSLDGRLIDAASIRMAENLLAKLEQIEAREERGNAGGRVAHQGGRGARPRLMRGCVTCGPRPGKPPPAATHRPPA